MRVVATLAGLAALAIATGCGSIPATRYYMLTIPRDTARNASVANGTGGPTVGVREFSVDPPYDRESLVYRIGERPTEIGFYDYHQWAAPLERMLPVVVAAALAGTGTPSLIEPDTGRRTYDAFLDGRVIALEEVDYPGRQDVRVRIELELRLANGSKIWSRVASGQSTTDAAEVAEIAEAMNELLVKLVEELGPELTAVLAEAALRTGSLGESHSR